MFFFFFADKLDERLYEPFIVSEKESALILDRLIQETNAQGLRNVELSALTGWSTSKVSKTLARKQKTTEEDIRVWARALGYVPDPFLTEGFDFRGYKTSDFVRSVTDSFDALLEADGDSPEAKAIVNYELPLSIVSLLGLKATEYCVRARNGGYSEASYIKIWNREAVKEAKPYPVISMWIEPHGKEFAFILYIEKNGSDAVLANVRSECKAILQKDEESDQFFRVFTDYDQCWIPREVVDAEVSSYCSTTAVLPDESLMRDILSELFREYSELVWQMNGKDIIPGYLKSGAESSFSPVEMFNLMTGNMAFDAQTVMNVRKANDCKCEIDSNHESFVAADGYPYVEVIPIIPFMPGAKYGKALLNEANAACLCPNCRAKMIYGLKDDREDMVLRLARKHRDALKGAGIDIQTSDLLTMYQL